MENLNENVTEEVVKEESVNTEPKKSAFTHNDFKSIMEMIKSMDEQLKYLKDMSYNLVMSNYRLKTFVLDDIIKYDKNHINEMTVDEIREFLSNYAMSEDVVKEINELSEEEIRDEIKEIKNSSLVLLSAKVESDKLKEDSNEILNEYMTYVTSDKAKEAKMRNLENLKKGLEVETDKNKKAKMEEMIKVMESSMNFDFLYDRFKAYGKDEIENIKKGFFNSKRGGYIMEKFYNKMKMFGFKQDLYTYFLNIEETFLEEEYHPFNNLFLFIYARMIAYSDPYSKKDTMFVHAINSGLASLIYHKFESTEQELHFKAIIKSIDDYFMDDKELFEKDNTTYEKHPERIQYESSKETALKKFYIDKLHSIDINDFDENLSSKELKEIYEEKYNTLVSTQVEEYDKEVKNKEENTTESDENVENESSDIGEENEEEIKEETQKEDTEATDRSSDGYSQKD